MKKNIFKISILTGFCFFCTSAFSQNATNYITTTNNNWGLIGLVGCVISFLIFLMFQSFSKFMKNASDESSTFPIEIEEITNHFDSVEIEKFLKLSDKNLKPELAETTSPFSSSKKIITSLILVLFTSLANAQTEAEHPIEQEPGIIITVILLLLPILLIAILIINKATKILRKLNNDKKIKTATEIAHQIKNNTNEDLEKQLLLRKQSLDFALNNDELSGTESVEDTKGIIKNVNDKHKVTFTAIKKKSNLRPILEPKITKLIIWYLGCAAFWLVIGTGIGEYVGIKFVMPDADHVSWLSFGRLRPVHTNIVFWGWCSLGILGLGYYVVPMVSNTKLYSIKWGWISLVLINLQVLFGSISLMAGVNNGGGEFREYIWPIMALFAVALILTLINFLKTVANRTTKEIYISNWYIIGSLIFTIIVASTAYLPFWQDGLGETIIQGYYMHSGVGMWFTLFTLGLLYYFIPQQLNKPIYAYSLGILAFWTQIIFYTIIGTHHFVFSAIPWWLQTIAIVGSAGMIIPVVAATINFVMTFKGQWSQVSNSYTLPFFLTAVLYYFVVSMQGTAEAFRYTNLLWHFTDFTVGHSHLGFYGIITFAIWGGAYAIVPRLTGKEPPHHLVGVHFWLASIGLLLYAIPLMVGGTIKGMMWMEGKPFLDSVVMMFDYWIWRAIGGSLMFVSHLIYFYNFYKMTTKVEDESDFNQVLLQQLEKEA
jgi:cytochrome c oxidase cbb3-type subunit 1